MLQSQVSAREIRRRLRNPVNGRESSEREIVSDPAARRLRVEASRRREEDRRQADIEARARAIEEVAQKQEEERLAAMAAATPADEVIPVVPRFTAIMGTICKVYDVTQIDLISSRRTADVVRPRQVLMYLARHLTAMSLPQIASRIGGRDHTTAISGVNKIKRLLSEGDKRLAADIDNIKWELGIR